MTRVEVLYWKTPEQSVKCFLCLDEKWMHIDTEDDQERKFQESYADIQENNQ